MAESDAATERELIFERRDDDVAVLTLNRPKARNTVSFAMWDQFSQALDTLEVDLPRAVVLCGAGGYFSSGGDVKTPPSRGDGAQRLAARLEMGQRIIARVRALPVPVIAAVEGGAFGVSWSLAMACDMIFASKTARFGAPFLSFGLVPDGGAAWFLSRQLGRHRAAEIIFSGRYLDAEEALAAGLVSRLEPEGTVVEAALAFASDIGSGNRHAVELTKRLLQTSDTSDLAVSHALELSYCHTCQAGDEVVRAREAFIARAAAAKAGKPAG
ncbi:enoyl-CoA hydratase/isomerase family protein [Sphingosinicella microcystinivorans]|uniref:enoyl-CoA hydratase/isomerase family protein n=1 Tax=Sphingosinicella microcystinivorans TaxID=335406 RepID=UPI0022F3B175|nr:enoyl-CoA hydratase/isomerase family protein [Sphingosinicella microcystinivorans]WBX82817.1 enoyl-CoA hydratase/isomerase family protein [Sphingosinicella microcystinivorans]